MRIDVAGWGECSVDEVARLDGPLRPGGKVGCGEVERLGGGQVATALVAARRLGARVAFLGPVGADAEGDWALAQLVAEGVAVDGAARRGRTRLARILVEPGGERTVLERRGDASQETVLTAAPRVLHLDGTDAGAALALAAQAHAGGARVSLDLERAPISDDCAPWALLNSADIAVVGAHEVADAEVEPRLRALAGAVGARARAALVGFTLGARGAALCDGERLWRQAALTPPALVDTTACGDTLRGALLVALLEAQPIAAALRFACAAAALKCRDLGRRGCPTRAELDAFLRAATGSWVGE